MTTAGLHTLAVGSLLFAMGAGNPCMAIERAKYIVTTSQPPFEVRDYASSVVAMVVVNGSRSDAVNSGFRLLANYIFGNNRQRSKIAMTAPVTQVPQSSRPLSTPIHEPAARDSWIVRFMMPAAYTLQSLPAPTDNRVRFEQSPPHRVAAIRFSGLWSDSNLKAHEARLVRWMATQHLTANSAPSFAYYDAPWTPWFMRTNEILIDVVSPQ